MNMVSVAPISRPDLGQPMTTVTAGRRVVGPRRTLTIGDGEAVKELADGGMTPSGLAS